MTRWNAAALSVIVAQTKTNIIVEEEKWILKVGGASALRVRCEVTVELIDEMTKPC